MSEKKLIVWCKWFIYLLPLIIIIFIAFRDGIAIYDVTNSNIPVINYFSNMFRVRVFNNLETWLITNNIIANNLSVFVFRYASFITISEFVFLIFDFILFLPRFIKGLMFNYDKKKKN